jgi:hypothetical protein
VSSQPPILFIVRLKDWYTASGALALFFTGLLLPQPDLKLAMWVAASLVGIYSLIQYVAVRREPGPPVDDDKHIVLFRTSPPLDEYSVSCPHCGEIYGLTTKICPRCHRSA